jgi:translocation and assembly module TamA
MADEYYVIIAVQCTHRLSTNENAARRQAVAIRSKKRSMRTPVFSVRAWLAVVLLTTSLDCGAADLSYEASGVSDPLLANVLIHLRVFSITRQSERSTSDYDDLLDDAIAKTKMGLRPYGYYQPTVTGQVVQKAKDEIVVRLMIRAGAPVLVDEVNIQVRGEGAERSLLTSWRNSWPLTTGQVLDQTIWDEQKQNILAELKRIGYFAAAHIEHRLELDLETNRANLTLTLDTGKRFLFGNIEYGEHVLNPGIVEYIPRFQTGDPFSATLLDKFRIDLWKSGYFTEVIVEEIPRENQDPPVVDLRLRLETATRNTYQGSIGYGTDTKARLQAQWSRHPMSRNGDRLDLGVGWQEFDDEYSLRGSYRLPQKNRARQFWTGDLTIRHENLDLDVQSSIDEEPVRIAEGAIDETHLRVGRMKVRNFKSGEQQAFETLFVQALNASDELLPVIDLPAPQALANNFAVRPLVGGTDKSVSVGFDYDLVAINGKAWATDGHRERAWVFASGTFLGSDRNFLQIFASTRRSYLKGDRWKFIVRAEAGYSDAEVSEYEIDIDGNPLPLSVTELPNFYRFRAGGSNSVRGYGFEELDNNRIGSNHIITASAEVEMKFLKTWSVALFFDIGNAFNDWSRPELKRGAGMGLRWYSIAGPIRVDVAQALDLIDKPWRIHFTIGTPLL